MFVCFFLLLITAHGGPYKERDFDKTSHYSSNINPTCMSAFLGPKLWDNTLPDDSDNLKFEYMDLEEFLSEHGISGSEEDGDPTKKNDGVVSNHGNNTAQQTQQQTPISQQDQKSMSSPGAPLNTEGICRKVEDATSRECSVASSTQPSTQQQNTCMTMKPVQKETEANLPPMPTQICSLPPGMNIYSYL